jgi:invasion protein IalB
MPCRRLWTVSKFSRFDKAKAILGASFVLIALGIYLEGTSARSQGLLLDSLSPQTQASGIIQTRRFQDWTVTCNQVQSNDPGECKMSQEIYTEDGADLLLLLSGEARPSGDGHSSAIFILLLPLGILLPEAVEINVDDGTSRKLAIRSCHVGGCLAPFILTPDLKREFQNGRSMTIRFKTVAGEDISREISLMGFAAALQAVVASE